MARLGLKSWIIQVAFGSVGFALLLQYGFIKPDGPFLTNVMWGAVNMVVARVAGLVLRGRKK